jgi:hypothetical protein
MSIFLAALLVQAATPAPATTPPTPPADAKLVCRTVLPTGSRLGGKRVCLPKSEWKRLHDGSREEVSELQDRASKQAPAGQ